MLGAKYFSDQMSILQIEHAPKCSHEAKLVKLADKLYNLRDLEVSTDKRNYELNDLDPSLIAPTKGSTPIGWEESRVDEYFKWAAKVCQGLRGTNAELEGKLEEIFKRRGLSAFAKDAPAVE